jgi:hypothetical protein
MAALDVTRVDGPHSPERTTAAASLIADAVRYLNYATLPASHAPGISYAGDVDAVLGSIQAAVGGLRQTLSQLEECLRDDLATGLLRLDAGKPHADDPARAVEVACSELEAARGECGQLQATLGRVRRFTAAMYLDDDGTAERGNY